MFTQWRRIVIAYIRTPIIGRIWMLVALTTLYSGGVYLLDVHVLRELVDIRSNVHVLLGTTLGFFLVFRTNTAYDRWWEGRKLWGQLVNDSRNFCINLRALSKIDPRDAYQLGRLFVNFARALKEHLREGVRRKQLSVYRNVQTAQEPTHIPSDVASMIWNRINQWRSQGVIDSFDLLILSPEVHSLMNICGACERIRKTPLSKSYRVFIRQCIALYLLSLPWGLVHDFNQWSIPAVMIVSYFMIGLEEIAADVEEPFGRGEDDLVLDDICQSIEASVTELLSTVREPVQPFKKIVAGDDWEIRG